MTYERCAKKRKRGYGTDLQRCLQVRQKVEVLRMFRVFIVHQEKAY